MRIVAFVLILVVFVVRCASILPRTHDTQVNGDERMVASDQHADVTGTEEQVSVGSGVEGYQGTLETQNEPHQKSPAVAVGLALGTTGIPIAIAYSVDFDSYWWLAASGFTIGPSAGHFYAGQWFRGAATAAMRGALLATGVYFSELMFVEVFSGWSSGSHSAAVAFASFLGSFGLALYDLATTEASVRFYNNALNASSRINLMPYRGVGNTGYGLSFLYRF